jgi:hypothetical protein
MEIPLRNKVLKIKLNISTEPNYKKLSRELSYYFDKNDICGNKIDKFIFSSTNVIIPENLFLEKLLYHGDYEKDLAKIGEKYGIKNLGFAHACYKNH